MDFHLGTAGVAGGLCIVLWFGTKGGGKVGTVSWGWTLFLSMVAGSAFYKAGPPFSWVSDLINDGLELVGEEFPKATGAGIALCIILLVCFKKMTQRQVALAGMAFFTVAAAAGGPFEELATKIDIIAQHWV